MVNESGAGATGAVAAEALPPLYAASDLMVWPAIHEAYGMALLEAQAALRDKGDAEAHPFDADFIRDRLVADHYCPTA